MRSATMTTRIFLRSGRIAALLLAGLAAAAAWPPPAPAESQSAEPRLIKELLEPAGGDLQDMVKRKFIRALVVYNKTQYFLDGARERGLAYELTQAFADQLNAKLKSQGQEVQVACIPVARDDLIAYLASGRGDIAVADLTATPGREKLVDFSQPFAEDISEVLVAGRKAPAVKNLAELSGKEVFVRKSSSYDESLRALNVCLEAEGKPPVRIKAADEHLEDLDIVEMVNAGIVGLTVVDHYKAELLRQAFTNIKVHGDVVLRQGGKFAVAMRKNCPELAAELNIFSREYTFSSSKFQYIFKKYVNHETMLRNNLASDDYRRFREAAVYFKKYAKEYDFDYLLIAAQSYQESRINQELRSPTGALGVMQVAPKTAKDPNIGVKNIEKLPNNVLAGVKYHRFIIDRYFNDPGVSPVDRQLFAFASYNAGPAKIMRLRQEAKTEGYDPNRWFGNVERLAAQRLGNETVRYVANIYKYYVAYQLAGEQEEQRARAKKMAGR